MGQGKNRMTEKEFWDMFNKKHNPRYYYDKKKAETENKKKTSCSEPTKRNPVFKVQD